MLYIVSAVISCASLAIKSDVDIYTISAAGLGLQKSFRLVEYITFRYETRILMVLCRCISLCTVDLPSKKAKTRLGVFSRTFVGDP
jgi:hypothetical protein